MKIKFIGLIWSVFQYSGFLYLLGDFVDQSSYVFKLESNLNSVILTCSSLSSI